MKKLLVSLLSLLLTFSLLMPIVAEDSQDTNTNLTESETTEPNTNEPEGTDSLACDATEAVACVGETGYKSLSEAVENSNNNDTIVLKGTKIECNEQLIIFDKKIVLDLNGVELEYLSSENKGAFIIIGNKEGDYGELTIISSKDGGKIIGNFNKANLSLISVMGENSKFILNSGIIEAKTQSGIYPSNGGNVIINGGEIITKQLPISGNNQTQKNNFEINGGIITALEGPAIYMPGQGVLNINGGTLNGGVSIRMGEVNITGGTINATTGPIDVLNDQNNYYSYGQSVWLADAVFVMGGSSYQSDTPQGNAVSLNITGGNINCNNGQGGAVAFYDLACKQQNANVNISGKANLFTTSQNREAYEVLTLSDLGVTDPIGGYGNIELEDKVSTDITGGLFSTDVSKYVKDKENLVQANTADKFAYGKDSVEALASQLSDDEVLEITSAPKGTSLTLPEGTKFNTKVPVSINGTPYEANTQAEAPSIPEEKPSKPDHNWVYRPSYNDSKDEEVKEYTTEDKTKACIELLGKGWEYSEANKSCVYTLDSSTQQIPNTSTK